MNKRNTFLYLNLYAAFLFLVIYALRMGVAFKTGLELSPSIIAKIVLMAGAAIVIFVINVISLNRKKIWLNLIQIPLLFPMFMPSKCVVKFGSAQNPVFILAMFLIIFASIILASNLFIVFGGEKKD